MSPCNVQDNSDEAERALKTQAQNSSASITAAGSFSKISPTVYQV